MFKYMEAPVAKAPPTRPSFQQAPVEAPMKAPVKAPVVSAPVAPPAPPATAPEKKVCSAY